MIKKILTIIVVAFSLFLIYGRNIPKSYVLPKKQVIKILFIGNSYIFTNDLPGMIDKIAKSDPNNKFELQVESFALGGASLKSLWNSEGALKLLRKQHWDYVVLQNKSLWAMYPQDVTESYDAARDWRVEVDKYSSSSVLYVTWARKPNGSWYSQEDTAEVLQNAKYMQSQTNIRSDRLAKILGSKQLLIGDAWAEMYNIYPNINLYNADESHPNHTGTYLTALIFYRYFAEVNSLNSISYAPQEVAFEKVGIVKDIALFSNYLID